MTVEAGRSGDPARDPDPGRGAARPARGGASGREAADGRRRGATGRRPRSRPTASATPRARSSCRWRRCSRDTPRTFSKADLSRGPARTDCAAGAALRRQRLVARHAARRRARRREITAAGDGRHGEARRGPGRGGEGRQAAGRASSFDYRGPDAAIAINRLLADGAAVSIDTGARRRTADRTGRRHRRSARLARQSRRRSRIRHRPESPARRRRWRSRRRGSGCTTPGAAATWTKAGRAGCWSSTGSAPRRCTTPTSGPAGSRDKYDVIILPDQSRSSILERHAAGTTRPEYRGGIGDEGVAALKSSSTRAAR